VHFKIEGSGGAGLGVQANGWYESHQGAQNAALDVCRFEIEASTERPGLSKDNSVAVLSVAWVLVWPWQAAGAGFTVRPPRPHRPRRVEASTSVIAPIPARSKQGVKMKRSRTDRTACALPQELEDPMRGRRALHRRHQADGSFSQPQTRPAYKPTPESRAKVNAMAWHAKRARV
jgi:hypothetical protein